MILTIFLVVELLSQIFQLETFGKIFVQFYVITIHGLVAVSLSTFDTRDLVYYFVILIAFVNSFRYFMYKIPTLNAHGLLRFSFDVTVIGALIFLMWRIDPFIQFDSVPTYSNVTQLSFLIVLSLTLLYEMIQRANQVGLHTDELAPRSVMSFLVITTTILGGSFISLSILLELNLAFRVQLLVGYVGVIIGLRILTLLRSKDSEFYNVLYVLPTLFTLIMFLQLILFGG